MWKIVRKRIQEQVWLSWKGDPGGIMQQIKICRYDKVYNHKPEALRETETYKIIRDVEIKTE